MLRSEIIERFTNLDGINEAKRIYKELAKLCHPDTDLGDTESFKILNEIYNDYLENGIVISEDMEFDLELEKIISQILYYEDLIIEVVGSWIWLDGNTKDIREHLKELGFKWRSKKKLWSYGQMKRRNPNNISMDDIKNKYGCKTVKTEGRRKVSA